MRRTCQQMHLDAAPHGAHEPLDDHRILVAFVLKPERMLCAVNEVRNPRASVVAAPDESRCIAGIERLSMPVRLEAGNDLRNFFWYAGDDGVVARLGTVACFPAARL